MTKVDVAIIGGGPGGLALAQGLLKHGFSVAIFEKDRARTDYVQGFRLRLRQRGIDALTQNLPSHLLEAFFATLGRAPSENLMLDENFEPRTGEAWRDTTAAADDTHPEKSVSRITLRQILLAGLGDALQLKTFIRYDEQPDGSVVAHFEDGSYVHAGILVGADGVASRVRKQLLPHATFSDTGVRRLAGKLTIERAAALGISPKLTDFNAMIRPRHGQSLMVTSHRVDPEAYRRYGLIGQDDETHRGIDGFHFNNTTSYVWWNTAYPTDALGSDDALAGMDGAQLLETLVGKIAHWHSAILDLIRFTDPSTVALLKVRTSVPVDPWPTRHVTLLGDAIHAMTYFRALGGNTAIHDSGILVRELAAAKRGDKALLDALRDYETQMLEHGTEAVRSSLTAMQKNVFGAASLQPAQ
jgi:2-polyprenyl-6-methoxyphenol hydroxylase-like FAD-dependent oxidoreductase